MHHRWHHVTEGVWCIPLTQRTRHTKPCHVGSQGPQHFRCEVEKWNSHEGLVQHTKIYLVRAWIYIPCDYMVVSGRLFLQQGQEHSFNIVQNCPKTKSNSLDVKFAQAWKGHGFPKPRAGLTFMVKSRWCKKTTLIPVNGQPQRKAWYLSTYDMTTSTHCKSIETANAINRNSDWNSTIFEIGDTHWEQIQCNNLTLFCLMAHLYHSVTRRKSEAPVVRQTRSVIAKCVAEKTLPDIFFRYFSRLIRSCQTPYFRYIPDGAVIIPPFCCLSFILTEI